MKRFRLLVIATIATSLFVAAGCGKKNAHDHGVSEAHVHKAPHGGTLIELGEHAYSLELVRDPAEGKMSAYVLDAHAEGFIRIKSPSFEAIVSVAGEKRALAFKAIANTATGETVGDTAQFDAQADWLKNTATFDGTLTRLEIRGTTFLNVAFHFPGGPHH